VGEEADVAVIDTQRAAVYVAEDQWSAVLDRGGTVDFFGSVLALPTQRRFGDFDAVRGYVQAVCTSVGISVPTVRARRGHTRAHYESATTTIAIPDVVSSGAWAARESVVLHELAHHWDFLEHGSLMHGAGFRTAMLTLVADTLGEEAALLLRAGYDGTVRG